MKMNISCYWARYDEQLLLQFYLTIWIRSNTNSSNWEEISWQLFGLVWKVTRLSKWQEYKGDKMKKENYIHINANIGKKQ